MVSTRRSIVKTEQLEDEFEPTSLSSHREAAPHDTSFELAERTSTAPSSQVTPPATMGGLPHAEGDHMEIDQGTTQQAMETLSADSHHLIQAMQKLEALGIEDVLPSLPKIVVIGDQSHGKSSIIEAVCDISLPRAAGTCTRCPFQITTTARSGVSDWICNISLLLRYQYNPNMTSEYEGWEDLGSQQRIEFQEVYDKADLERWLRLAQIAICQPEPSAKAADIAKMNDLNYGYTIEFSPNIISIEISAPGLPEMSLTDLPGTINVHQDASKQYLVDFIGALVKTYLEEEHAHILLAASADQNLENSTAMKCINNHNASARSMGVLTKPDLSTFRVTDLHKVLSGKTFKLTGGGWYVTKLLSQDDVDGGTSHAQAREAEQAFFAQHPWNSTLSAFSDRFGIPNLQKELSRILTTKIKRQLPDLLAEVKRAYQEVSAELLDFPEQDKDAQRTVRSKINQVTLAITKQLNGDSIQGGFYAEYKAIIKHLGLQFRKARPQFDFATPGAKKIITINDDSEDDSDTVQSSAAKRRKGNDSRAAPTPQRPADKTPRTPRTPIKQEKDTRTPATPAIAPVKFTLLQVRKAYSLGEASTIDPHNGKVTDSLIRSTIQRWDDIVDAALQSVHAAVASMLNNEIEAALSGYQKSKLFDQTQSIVHEVFMQLKEQNKDSVLRHIKCEMHKPNTFQKELLGNQTAAREKELRADREECRGREYIDAGHLEKKFKNVEQDKQAQEKQLAEAIKCLGPDKYTKEIAAIARILAYYDIASAPLPDFVAKKLELDLFSAMEEQLQGALIEKLNTADREYCAELVAEDPERERTRRKLTEKQHKLKAAMDELKSLYSREE